MRAALRFSESRYLARYLARGFGEESSDHCARTISRFADGRIPGKLSELNDVAPKGTQTEGARSLSLSLSLSCSRKAQERGSEIYDARVEVYQ